MKKTLSFLFLFFTCIHCAESQEKINPFRQIPILAWNGIPPEETSVARYEELIESGITYNLTSFPDLKTMAAALKVAQKIGVKMIISCPELGTDTKKTVRRFMRNPAVAGYYLKDEPNSRDFSGLAEWVKKIRAIDDNHFCYINLFPNYANEEQLGAKTYEDYVNLFIQEVPIKHLSFDYYPVIGDSLQKRWYENLGIFSEKARKERKPFWAFALAVSHQSYPIPTVAELRLQVYSDLAYGAQGIQYFTYWTPKSSVWDFHHGPIALDSKRTEVYDRIKLMNKEIKDLSWVFLGAKVISVVHTGDMIPQGTKRLTKLPPPIKVLETKGTGAVVSVLEKAADNFLVIVNRDFNNTMQLTIGCDATVKKVLKDGSMVPASAYIGTLEIDPGDVAIYKWTNK